MAQVWGRAAPSVSSSSALKFALKNKAVINMKSCMTIHIIGWYIFMRRFIPCNMDWRLIVPGETGWDAVDWTEAREVRLRPGQGAAVAQKDGVWYGRYRLTPQDVLQAAQALTGHALAARQEELSRGFVPLKGGHRLGAFAG